MSGYGELIDLRGSLGYAGWWRRKDQTHPGVALIQRVFEPDLSDFRYEEILVNGIYFGYGFTGLRKDYW